MGANFLLSTLKWTPPLNFPGQKISNLSIDLHLVEGGHVSLPQQSQTQELFPGWYLDVRAIQLVLVTMTTGGSGPRGDPPRNGRAAGSNYNLDERLVTRCYHERWLPGEVSTRCSFGRSLCEGPEATLTSGRFWRRQIDRLSALQKHYFKMQLRQSLTGILNVTSSKWLLYSAINSRYLVHIAIFCSNK